MASEVPREETRTPTEHAPIPGALSPALSAATSVQAMPEYAKAKAACAHGRYREAADILANMERTPSLTADERAFCRQQQAICLGHLGRSGVGLNQDSSDYGIGMIGRRASVRFRAAVSASGQRAGSVNTRLEGVGVQRAQSSASRSVGENADCGPRALLLACEKLGVRATLPALRQAAGTDSTGSSMAGLKRAAEGLRLKAEGIQAGREALSKLPTPAIAWVHGDHYIVVLALKGEGEGTAVIHDPNEPAERTIAQERLLQMSGGYLLTLRK